MAEQDRPRNTSATRKMRRGQQARSPHRGRGLLASNASAGVARLIGEGHALDTSHPALEPPAEALQHERPGSLDKVVFGITAVLSIAFVLWGALSPNSLIGSAGTGLDWVVGNTGWLFAIASTGFVFYILWLAASAYGEIPLGRDGEEPEFSTTSWVAMMFSAGMGIGLMFYGAAEPLAHFVTPPPGTGDQPDVKKAMATTMFHWGLHPWAIYAIVGVAIAYGVFRKGRPLTISAVFEPILGKKQTYGPAGKVIDIFAIFATLFGSATSLGLGALQIAKGVEIVGWMGKAGNTFLVLLITALTICFILSAVSGVGRGIQYLSNINMVLAVLLALFVFVFGPTVFILNLIPSTLGTYLQDLMMMSARTGVTSADASAWLGGWTIFYWAWWVSWTPFVGMFIARISKGRTIRQFVTGVLLLPTIVSLVWFSIFGGSAIKAEEGGAALSKAGSEEATLFALLDTMPLASITSVLVMVLVGIFFVSGADAASIVMGTLSENGTIEPSRWNVIFWGSATGAVAAIMLVAAGQDGLSGLQTIIVVAGLPFMLIMIGMAIALWRDLHNDPMIVRRRYARAAIETAVVAGVKAHGDDFSLAIDQTAPGEGVGALVDTTEIEAVIAEDEAAKQA